MQKNVRYSIYQARRDYEHPVTNQISSQVLDQFDPTQAWPSREIFNQVSVFVAVYYQVKE